MLAAGVDPDGFTRGWFELWRERFDGTFCDDARRVFAGCARRWGLWPIEALSFRVGLGPPPGGDHTRPWPGGGGSD